MSDYPKVKNIYGEVYAPGVKITVEDWPGPPKKKMGEDVVRLSLDGECGGHLDFRIEEAVKLRDALTLYLEATKKAP